MKRLFAATIATCAAVPLALAEPATDEHVSETGKAKIVDTQGEEVGVVVLRQGPNGTLFDLELEGLEPGFKAIHVHAVGKCDDHEDGFEASGGHLNPDDKDHGLMNPDGPDAGDFPNFYVHQDGYAKAQFFSDRVSLDGEIGAKLMDDDGAALVIHENPDDHASQPIGGAGDRIACGVIEQD